jgi:hypothetical protein
METPKMDINIAKTRLILHSELTKLIKYDKENENHQKLLESLTQE